MSEPRKHHYVPQFYQRGFINNGSKKIWVYQKAINHRRYSTRKTGMKIDLYAFRNSRGEVDFSSVEKQLALIDDRAAKIVQKLERGEQLRDKDRMRLCKFLSVMWRRTPKHLNHVNQTTVELLPKVLEPFDDLGDHLSREARAEVERISKQYTEKPPDFLFAHNVLSESAFERLMYQMDWAFFKPSPSKEFLTCDDPALSAKGRDFKAEMRS